MFLFLPIYVMVDLTSSAIADSTVYETTVTGMFHKHEDGYTMIDTNNTIMIVPDSDEYYITLSGHSSYWASEKTIESFNIGEHVEISSSVSMFGNEHIHSVKKLS